MTRIETELHGLDQQRQMTNRLLLPVLMLLRDMVSASHSLVGIGILLNRQLQMLMSVFLNLPVFMGSSTFAYFVDAHNNRLVIDTRLRCSWRVRCQPGPSHGATSADCH